MASSDALGRGWEALQAWRWDEARAAFEEALVDGDAPEALEGLGVAAGWLEDPLTAIDARERAFRLYRERGDPEGAARVAAGLIDAILTFRGDPAVAAGWIERARHGLRHEPGTPALAFIDVLDAYMKMAYEHNVSRAIELAEAAVERSRKAGDLDSEMIALSVLGVITLSSGRSAEGGRMLDEAVAAVVGGEVRDANAAANICCALVTAGARTRDLDRLAQWSRYVMDMSREWPNRAMFTYPRTEHALVLIWWGRWAEAEAELLGVLAQAQRLPLYARLATLRLAELRRRQGRFDEATALLRELQEVGAIGVGQQTTAVAAAVALDRGAHEEAVDLAERHLRTLPEDDVVGRVDALEVLAHARSALGDADGSTEAALEIGRTAEQVPTGPIAAAARLAAGVVDAARGDHAAARRALEEAVDRYERSGAPFEAARARLELGRCLGAIGLTAAAAEETRRAYSAFEALGAEHWSGVAESLVAATGGGSDRRPSGLPLTPREVEVLRLIAAGRSNDEIAAMLVLSVRTVERHVSNIYAKIGAYGRTARAVATAYAHTHSLT